MTLVVSLLAVVVAILALLVVGLLRSHAEILRRLHDVGIDLDRDENEPIATLPLAPNGAAGPRPRRDGAPTGRPAHDVVGATADGGETVLRTTEVAHDTLLAFLSTGCTGCVELWSGLDEDDLVLPDGLRLVVVTQGPTEESPAEVARLAPSGVQVIMSSQAWHEYEVPGSPYVIHVDGPSGRVRGEGTGTSWEQLRRLLSQATGDVGYLEGASAKPRKARPDRLREQDTDRALLAAGIGPGDGRLYGRDADDPPTSGVST